MRHRVRIDDVNVIDFPPPVSTGQKEWELHLAAQLRQHLPQDQVEAAKVVAIMKEAIERRSNEELLWQRTLNAAYVLSMLPEDCRTARRVVNELCGDADD